MVRCSDVELMGGLKKRKKSSKRKEPMVSTKVEVIPDMPTEEPMATKVPIMLAEVQREVEAAIVPVEV